MAETAETKFSARVRPWMSRRSGLLSNLGLSLLLAGLGWFAVQWREMIWPSGGDEPVDWTEMGMDPLQRLSYDVPFLLRGTLGALAGGSRTAGDVVIVYLDELSASQLEEPATGAWNRATHAELVRRLTAAGARAIVFDLIFDRAGPKDAELAVALRQHGNVFLGATISTGPEQPLTPDVEERFRQVGLSRERLVLPTPELREAARGWGVLTFRPVDADYGVRRLFVGKRRGSLSPWPAVTWETASALGAALPQAPEARFARRWVNYHGPAGTIEHVSYYRVLQPGSGVRPEAFKDKIVLVGGRSELGSGPSKLLDEFSTPWSRFRGRAFTPGTEIHATILLNLLQHDWLERVSTAAEKWTIVLLGLALGALRWLRPWRIVMAALALMAAVTLTACLLQWRERLWWNWTVPVAVQIPLGAVLAIGSRYYLEERRKRKLRQAFGFYLSPELAGQIAEQNFSLAPGGREIVVTQIFTDLEGFTTLSEKLKNPARIGQVLVEYFTRTTEEIFVQQGTVIKFVGDAVHAAWGAPLEQPDHAERAVRAAWRLAQVAKLEVPVVRPDGTTEVMRVRTRIGVHTGEALAGNLGSAKRFDYAVIGDATNFAARLEGTNKFLGTSILLSDDTAQRLNGKFLLRRLGAFKMKGKTRSVVIHELLGEDAAARPAWLERFDAGLGAWERGDFATARENFSAVRTARGGADGPAQFYLERIERVGAKAGSSTWTGEVALEEK